MIKNQHNPQFVKAIEMAYQFEVIQKMRFEVYDDDNSKFIPDFCLGYMECTLAEVGNRANPLEWLRTYLWLHLCLYL